MTFWNKLTINTLRIMAAVTMGAAIIIGGDNYNKKSGRIVEKIIANDKSITAKEYANYSQRVAEGKTTWQEIADSINKTKPGKIKKIQQEIVEDKGVTAKKFYEFKQRAGKDLEKWRAINDSLKAQRTFKLYK